MYVGTSYSNNHLSLFGANAARTESNALTWGNEAVDVFERPIGAASQALAVVPQPLAETQDRNGYYDWVNGMREFRRAANLNQPQPAETEATETAGESGQTEDTSAAASSGSTSGSGESQAAAGSGTTSSASSSSSGTTTSGTTTTASTSGTSGGYNGGLLGWLFGR